MKKFLLLSSVSAVLLVLCFAACKKPVGPSTAVIKVVDTTGSVVTGATVRVFCTEDLCVVDDTAFSDLNGESEHEFDLPAVLRVQVWKDIATTFQTGVNTFEDTTFTLYGEGFVRLDEGERTTQVITVFGSNLQ